MEPDNRPASPKDPARPLHRPPSPPPAGIDNQGYTPDSADPNHNDSFTSKINGQLNGETKTPEAVNLELINLKPQNGQNGHTKSKKDVEVDMNATNPYDEYFVPVNEHRKYMRGEKLYVTQDKRSSEKGGCKRPLCWTMLCLVVAAVVVLIVLAATGVLFANSPTPVEQYNSSISSARALGGLGLDHGHDHGHEHDKHGPDTQADQEFTVSEENVDSAYYVPHTLEGELKIDNEEFDQQMEDLDSDAALTLRRIFADALRAALFDRTTLEKGDHDINVEVVNIRQGSIIVTYRIHWVPKKNSQKELDMDAQILKTRLQNYLARNDRMISTYHIAEDKMEIRPVLDLCQNNKNDCENGCEFDESTLEFSCSCPTGQMVIGKHAKKCVPILDDLQNKLSTSTTPTATMISTEYPNSKFDWKESVPQTTEPSTESEADLNFSHIFGGLQLGSTSLPEPAAEPPNVEPETELTSISELDSATSAPVAEPEPTSEPSSEPEPVPELKTEPEPNSEPKSEPEPTTEPKPEPKPTAEPKSESEPTAEPKSEPEPTAEPKSEPEPEPNSQLDATSLTVLEAMKPEPTAEPTAEPEPEPTSEPTSQPEPEPKVSDSYETELESKSESESKSYSESKPEPSSEPEPTAEPKSEPEPTSEPNTEPDSKPEPTVDPEAKPESTSEPTSDPDLVSIIGLHKFEDSSETTMRVSISEPNKITEPSYEPKPEIVSILGDTNDVHEITTTENYEKYTRHNQHDDNVDETDHITTTAPATERVILTVTTTEEAPKTSQKDSSENTTESQVNETIMKAIQEKTTRLDEARQLNLNETESEPHQSQEKDTMDGVTSISDTVLTTTETNIEPGDVTFDAIHKIHSTIDEIMPESETTTTESSDNDWLAQTVTEISFDESEQKPKATTVATTIKAEDIILNKEDFEPDYLSLDPTTKKVIVEDTLYMSMGMPHDYDSEDPRQKRTEPVQDIVKETSTQAMAIETTPIGQFIYNAAEQANQANKVYSEPAPVWEEGDGERDVYNMRKPQDIFSGDIKTQETLINEPAPTDVPQHASINNVDEMKNETNNSDINSESPNLNVTIYEVRNHSGNDSFSASKSSTTTQSAEYEDHETEMNPFLPEVENNKSLVKKLQEGHDLEPVNLNETQNEAPDEPVIVEKGNENNTTINNEQTTSFEDFIANAFLKPAKNETDYANAVDKTMNEKDDTLDKETSTFLQDTDDLVTTKMPTSEAPVTEHKDQVTSAANTKDDLAVSFDSPVVSTESPAVSSANPSVASSESPAVSADSAIISFSNSPVVPSVSSSISTDSPAVSSENPSEFSDTLSVSTDSQAVSSEDPDVTFDNQSLSTNSPAPSSENPAESSDNPTTSNDSPAVSSETPTESSDSSVTTNTNSSTETSNSPALPDINMGNVEADDDDDEYLSVVPIENEPIRKINKSSSIQGINDISDSPKKSDRRTFEASKLDAENNEA